MGTSDRLLDASALRDWAHTSVSDLITHIDEINRLNVFPVADSDTGANMLFTMRSALAEANGGASANAGCAARAAAALSAGALNGARGNSGVILSQILRGIADVTAAAAADAGGELRDIDAYLLGSALRRGVALVITSMGDEVPGTIVSVLRAAADAVGQCARDGLGAAVAAAGDAAVVALEKTPEQLDVSLTPGRWTPAAGACWSCWTRCGPRSPGRRPNARCTSFPRAPRRPTPRVQAPNAGHHNSR